MIGEGREVRSDLYFISDRIREIDPDYFIWYSYRTRRYEVHHRRQSGSTLCLVIPYPHLDERTLRLVRKTRVERADECLREMQEENARAEKAAKRAAVKRAERLTETLLQGG